MLGYFFPYSHSIKMPARVTVYCHKSVAHTTAQEIRKGLEPEDWYLMGEMYDVGDEETVNLALSYFYIEGENGHFTLHFRPPEQRQLEIAVIDGQKAREWMDEQIDDLEYKKRSGYEQLVQHLRDAIEIVDIQTGYFQFVEMASAFAYAVARWFAKMGDGWIRADDGEWWKIEGYTFTKIISTNETATKQADEATFETVPLQQGEI